MTTNTNTAAKLTRPVTFNYATSRQFTVPAGVVVDFEPYQDDMILIRKRGYSRVISMDDAIPVYWDADEEMWVEE